MKTAAESDWHRRKRERLECGMNFMSSVIFEEMNERCCFSTFQNKSTNQTKWHKWLMVLIIAPTSAVNSTSLSDVRVEITAEPLRVCRLKKKRVVSFNRRGRRTNRVNCARSVGADCKRWKILEKQTHYSTDTAALSPTMECVTALHAALQLQSKLWCHAVPVVEMLACCTGTFFLITENKPNTNKWSLSCTLKHRSC